MSTPAERVAAKQAALAADQARLAAPHPTELAALFLFHPDLGDEATEFRKVLYFYPSCEDSDQGLPRDVQSDYCGIAEAIINFSRDFSGERGVQTVHCRKHRYVFHRCEGDFWLVMVLRLPTTTKEPDKKKGSVTPAEVEYHNQDVGDDVLLRILQRMYDLFRLLHGSFADVLRRTGEANVRTCDCAAMARATRETMQCNDCQGCATDMPPPAPADETQRDRQRRYKKDVDEQPMLVIRRLFARFMAYYLPTIRFSQLPLYSDIQGVQFLPVDKATFLTVQYLVHLIQEAFPVVRHAMIMQRGKLIWSGIQQRDMFLFYTLEQAHMHPFWFFFGSGRGGGVASQRAQQAARDLQQAQASTSKGKAKRTALQKATRAAAEAAEAEQSGEGFILNPAGDGPCAHPVFIRPHPSGAPPVPPMGLAAPPEGVHHRLIVYRRHHITVFFIVQDKEQSQDETQQFFRRLDSYVRLNLEKLSVVLDEQVQRISRKDETFRFLYFNHMNLALKTSSLGALSADAVRIINEIHADFGREKGHPARWGHVDEVCIKTKKGWIVGKRGKESSREFFVFVDDKNANLADVQGVVTQLSRAYFFNIFVY